MTPSRYHLPFYFLSSHSFFLVTETITFRVFLLPVSDSLSLPRLRTESWTQQPIPYSFTPVASRGVEANYSFLSYPQLTVVKLVRGGTALVKKTNVSAAYRYISKTTTKRLALLPSIKENLTIYQNLQNIPLQFSDKAGFFPLVHKLVQTGRVHTRLAQTFF